MSSNYFPGECEKREEAISTTIQLYNKARLLASGSFLEVKVFLKAAAASMLSAYGGRKLKCMVSCIRLHCRSAAELISHFPNATSAATLCLNQAIIHWTCINNQALERMLNVQDLEDLRLYMFHCYVALGRLLIRQKSRQFDDIKVSVSGAMELVNALPAMQLLFAQHAVDVGYYFTIENFYAESVTYFSRAVALLDVISQDLKLLVVQRPDPDPNCCESTELSVNNAVKAVRVKALLSMAYIFNELNQREKALYYIEIVSHVPGVQSDVILFAEFSVACRHGDEAECLNFARKIMISTTSYSIAINTLQMYCNLVGDYAGRAELFESILVSFPNEPDYSNSRLCHLRQTISTFRHVEADCGSKSNYSIIAYDLCESIVRDHIGKRHILQIVPQDQCSQLVGLIKERVSWFRAKLEYKTALDWLNLLLMLPIDANDGSETLKNMILQAELLFLMSQFEAALKLAHDIAENGCISESFPMVFKCALFARSPVEASRLVINCHRKHIMAMTRSQPEIYDRRHRLSDLNIFLLCCKEAYLLNDESLYPSIILLLEEYLNQYVDHKLWEVASDSSGTKLLQVLYDFGYLSFLCYCSRNRQTSIVNPDKDNEEALNLEQTSSLVLSNVAPTGSQKNRSGGHSSEPVILADVLNDIGVISEGGSEDIVSRDITKITKRKRDLSSGHYSVDGELNDSRKSPKLNMSYSHPSSSPLQLDPSAFSKEFFNETASSLDNRTANVISSNAQNASIQINFDSDLNESMWNICCGIEVWDPIIAKIKDILALSCMEVAGSSVLSDDHSVQKIADLCWNLGKVFLYVVENSGNLQKPIDESSRLLLSSECFETAFFGYSNIANKTSCTGIKNRILCLLAGLAERLDADSCLRDAKDWDLSCADKRRASNVCAIHANFRELKTLFALVPSLEERPDEFSIMKNIFVLLEFSGRCRSYAVEGQSLNDFVDKNEGLRPNYYIVILQSLNITMNAIGILLSLSAEELELCSDISSNERNGTVEVSRRLLLLAVQKNIQSIAPSWSKVGSLYKRIIKLSTSRHEVRTCAEFPFSFDFLTRYTFTIRR